MVPPGYGSVHDESALGWRSPTLSDRSMDYPRSAYNCKSRMYLSHGRLTAYAGWQGTLTASPRSRCSLRRRLSQRLPDPMEAPQPTFRQLPIPRIWRRVSLEWSLGRLRASSARAFLPVSRALLSAQGRSRHSRSTSLVTSHHPSARA